MPSQYWRISQQGKSADLLIYGVIGDRWDDTSPTAQKIVNEIKSIKGATHLNVRLASPGGNVFEGIGIYNAIKAFPGTVDTYVDSNASSMASVIFMAGKNRYMGAMSTLMIHNPSGGVYGESKDMLKMVEVLDMMKVVMIPAYADPSSQSVETVSAWMDAETWFTADEAVANGFATALVPDMKIAAQFDGEFYNEVRNSFKFPEKLITQPIEDTKMGDKIEPVAPVAAVAIDGAKVEFERSRSIRNAFEAFPEQMKLMNACLDDPSCSLEKSLVQLTSMLGKGTSPVQEVARAEVGESASDKFMKGAEAAIEMRAGLVKAQDVKNEFRSYTMVDLARHALSMKGIKSGHMDRMTLVGLAMTSTSDFPKLLANSAHKSLQKGYDTSPETYSRWTQRGVLTDFKVADRVGMSEFSVMDVVFEGGEYKQGKFAERREQVQLLTYGKKFAITRQALINDDLSVFTKIPTAMGGAARRKVGDLAYAVLTANAAMADTGLLFNATAITTAGGHANLTSSGTAISVASLSVGKAAMAKQKDQNDTTANLNIRAAYLLVPVAIEDNAMTVIRSATDVSQANPNKANIHQNTLEVISDARLDTVSATAWYLAAGNAYDTVEVSFLDGNDSPVLEQQAGWDMDGMEFKVRIDAAAKAIEWRTMYKNVGA